VFRIRHAEFIALCMKCRRCAAFVVRTRRSSFTMPMLTVLEERQQIPRVSAAHVAQWDSCENWNVWNRGNGRRKRLPCRPTILMSAIFTGTDWRLSRLTADNPACSLSGPQPPSSLLASGYLERNTETAIRPFGKTVRKPDLPIQNSNQTGKRHGSISLIPGRKCG
jgi:hypothetical protein